MILLRDNRTLVLMKELKGLPPLSIKGLDELGACQLQSMALAPPHGPFDYSRRSRVLWRSAPHAASPCWLAQHFPLAAQSQRWGPCHNVATSEARHIISPSPIFDSASP